MAVGGIVSGIAYLTVYSRLIVYWMIAAGGLIAVDLLVIDFVLQVKINIYFKDNKTIVWLSSFQK